MTAHHIRRMANPLPSVYLCDITMSSGGAVSLPEEVRRWRADSVATTSNQALRGLLFVLGGDKLEGPAFFFFFLAETRIVNSQTTCSQNFTLLLTSKKHNVLSLRWTVTQQL